MEFIQEEKLFGLAVSGCSGIIYCIGTTIMYDTTWFAC